MRERQGQKEQQTGDQPDIVTNRQRGGEKQRQTDRSRETEAE